MLFLKENDVEELFSMDIAINVLEKSFRHQALGKASNSPRRRIPLGHGMFHFMAAADINLGVLGMKSYSTFKDGKARFYVYLNDSATGDLIAVIEADRMGQIRTGAASGVATRYMARDDSKDVGIIGSGYQAETQLEAICRVREIEIARVYSRTPSRCQDFAKRMASKLDINVIPVDSAEKCVENADIVSVITSSSSPVLKGEWMIDGTHINAAGGNHWLRRELDGNTVTRANVVVTDDVEQARIECAELIHSVERGTLTWHRVRELWEVASGAVLGRTGSRDITLFESQGIALEDIAAGFELYTMAKDLGVGTELNI